MIFLLSPRKHNCCISISINSRQVYFTSKIITTTNLIAVTDMHNQITSLVSIVEESAVVEWLALGISKPGVPGSIPSHGTTVMVECPWARHIFKPSTGLFTKGS